MVAERVKRHVPMGFPLPACYSSHIHQRRAGACRRRAAGTPPLPPVFSPVSAGAGNVDACRLEIRLARRADHR
jgi:hypothetical protein